MCGSVGTPYTLILLFLSANEEGIFLNKIFSLFIFKWISNK